MSIFKRILYYLMQFRARRTSGTSSSGHALEFIVICSEQRAGTIIQHSKGSWTA